MHHSLKKHIPNLITLMNLGSGVFAILAATEHEMGIAVAFILLAAVFDFLDGLAARALHVVSDIGKQLDSLADLVSFGVAPAFICMSLLKLLLFGSGNYPEILALGDALILFSPILIPLFSAYRLAKFNVDTRQTTHFHGLPTPANALFFTSFALIYLYQPAYNLWLEGLASIFPIIVLIFSILMVSDIRMFSLKFKDWGFSANKFRYLFLGGSAILLISLHAIAIPMVVVLYIVMSGITNLINRKHS
ncbi:MAG: CDP-diacylglycerol--serine O-phosphatidyltransferase [Bacteroidales bacterium]